MDLSAGARLAAWPDEDWLLIHGVHLPDDHGLAGTVVHNPRSNMNNAVGYARPARFGDRVVLGTDGIGGDMLEEFRLAYARLREDDVTAPPVVPWGWLEGGYRLVPEAAHDVVVWDRPHVAAMPWWAAYTPGVRALDVTVAGEKVLQGGVATRVDAGEVGAKAAEQAARLFARL